MPFKNCIAAALADQLLTQAEADDYNEMFDHFEQALHAHMPPDEAAAEAARSTFATIERDAAERRRQTFLSLAAQKQLSQRMDSFRDPMHGNREDPYRAALGFWSRILPGRNGMAAEQQREFWRGQAHALMDEAFDTWRRDFLARRRNQPRMLNILRELEGQNTGDAAAQALAKGWLRVSEMLRQAFNRFGGHIGHLDNWLMPTIHDWRRIRAAGREDWKAFITPLLDRGRMVDFRTNVPLSDARLSDLLDGMWKNIVTGGWANREATGNGGRALANRYAEHRVTHFQNADAWHAYQQRFGDGDVVNAMLRHIDSRARDIALMQVFGPNPAAMIRWVNSEITRRARIAGIPERADWAHGVLARLETNYRGGGAREHPMVELIADDVKNFLTSAQLGAAVIPSVPSDINMQRLTRQFNGLPAIQALTTYLRRLDPTDPVSRMTAIRAGLGAQRFAQTLHMSARYVGEIAGHRWSQWLSDRTLAATRLTQWTDAGRGGYGVDVFAHIAANRAHDFDALDAPFRAYLQRYGIGKRDWNTIRSTQAYTEHSPFFGRRLDMIRPSDIFARTDIDQSHGLDVAAKLADAAMSETEFAVPSHSLESAAILKGPKDLGTVRRLGGMSFAMYRGFGATMMLTHMRRMVAAGPSLRAPLSYMASLAIGSTVGGAIAIQMRELAHGRDPRPMDDWRFWLAAFITGGGFGILSDFAYAGLQGDSANGQNLEGTAAGPLAEVPMMFIRALFGGDPIGPASKESRLHENLATRMLYLGSSVIPGGNAWYLQAALQRAMWDQLQAQVDPGWNARVRAIESRQRRQYGNGYWWHRGDVLPDRAPDLATAGGQQ